MNITHIIRFTSNPKSSSFSACSWLFALILCCLPGASLYNADLPANESQRASSLDHLHSIVTRGIVSINDGALAQRNSGHVKRSGVSPTSTDRDSPNPFEPEFHTWAWQSDAHIRAPIAGQGYDSHNLILAIRQTTSPHSPRAPPPVLV